MGKHQRSIIIDNIRRASNLIAGDWRLYGCLHDRIALVGFLVRGVQAQYTGACKHVYAHILPHAVIDRCGDSERLLHQRVLGNNHIVQWIRNVDEITLVRSEDFITAATEREVIAGGIIGDVLSVSSVDKERTIGGTIIDAPRLSVHGKADLPCHFCVVGFVTGAAGKDCSAKEQRRE